MSDMARLHVERYGAPDAPTVLAIHGITGHGKRWESLAHNQLSDYRVLAPDLIGHGSSDANPPWSMEAQIAALAELLSAELPAGTSSADVTVVGHSYGGALAIHLSRHIPVRGLVLLDPAMALAPHLARAMANHTLADHDYADIDEARAAKKAEAWGEVADELLDADLHTDLVPTDDGRVRFRFDPAAVIATWGELARPTQLPAAGIRIELVRAAKVVPPYIPDSYVDALRASHGDLLTVHDIDTDHMVPQVVPDLVADLVAAIG
ncbi:alpha/beta hydrolase [Gordonia jinhuaensis]|uniref:Hydrolase, alpha/beta fold LipV n=2 Tax=Gordonia jinhuaensis TaxID=1517702 RepID=A0A916TA38_9ACTN|nr:putative hydrolase, alpha/beta fold LipV [Gordonia jinhuaensis]